MNRPSQSIKILLTMAVCLITGCTAQLWKDTPTYHEWITGFYISTDKNLLVGVSKEYSYLFTIEPDLTRVLMLNPSVFSDLVLRPFTLDKENNVTGDLVLYSNSAELNQAQFDLITDLNFRKYRNVPSAPIKDWQPGTKSWRRGDYRLVSTLEGRRYVTEVEGEIQKLNTPLFVMVERPISPTEITEKILITPGLIVTDVAITVVALPITFPMLFDDPTKW